MLWPRLGGEKVRDPTSWAVPVDGTGTASVGAVKAPLVPGVQKPSSLGRKTVPGPSLGGTQQGEGEETSRSENETRLVAARPPGHEPSGLPRAARCGVRYRAGLKAADGDHLVPQPDSDGEGAGAAAQDCVGAVVERLKGWNPAAPTDPDKGGRRTVGLAACWAGRC